MDFRILGPLEALEEGERVALGGSRQRALLAVFLLHANETLSTDRLIDELWGESPPISAGKTVQVRISRLRKALTAGSDDSGGNGLLVTRDYGYELRLAPDRLDSHRFERLAAEGRRELAAGRPEAAVSAFERALSLWRGEPLGDLAYEPFAQLEIARLRDMRVAVREQLIDAKLALGGHSDVVGELEALIGENPLRERLRGQLMLALYRCERQADALQAYQDARRRLVEELGIEPGQRLRDLERAILAQDPALQLPPLETAEPPPVLGASTPATDSSARLPAVDRESPAEVATSRRARKVVTVLFCDVTGSTALGKELDPEALFGVMNRCFEELRAIVERHGGTVAKFIGGAVVAVIGIPRVHEDDALRAVRAAAEIRTRLPAIARELGVELRFRTGVNTGLVLVGEGENLAVGDAFNVAARLEQTAQPGEIVLSESTHGLVRDAVEVEPLEALSLKGKSEPVASFRLLGVDPLAPGLARRFDVPLVGRERELRLLGEAWDRAVKEAGCHLFTLLGAAGVGKSRLVAELLSDVGDEARVLAGRCLPYGESITFWPLVEALSLVREPAQPVLERLRTGGTVRPEELFFEVRRLLESLAAERPVVLHVDDLQWAEPMLLDLLDHVVELSRDTPILVLCTARPELLEDRPAWGGGKLNATTMMLEPLRTAECEALLVELGNELDPLARAHVVSASEGNPLFLEEMSALARETGSHAVPPTIQALLAARLERLAVEEREVLQRGAIEGEVFHRQAVRALSDERTETEVDLQLAGLVRKELIRPHRATIQGEDAFRFRHLLIRDAVYDGLPKTRRADLHERFARWLEQSGGDIVELDEIAGWHLEQTLGYRRELGRSPHDALARDAADHLHAAGRRARERRDVPAAKHLLERALSLAQEGDTRGALIAADLTEVLVEAGELANADQLLTEIEHDPDVSTVAALTRFEWMMSVRPPGTTSTIKSRLPGILKHFARVGDERGLARAHMVAYYLHWIKCLATPAGDELRLAAEHARNAGDDGLRQRALAAYVGTLTFGRADAQTIANALDAIEREQPGPYLAASVDNGRSEVARLNGRFSEARRLQQRAIERWRSLGLPEMEAGYEQTRGWLELSAGDPAAALATLQRSDAILAQLGERALRSTTQAHLAQAYWQLENAAAAIAAIELSEELGDPEDVVNFIITHGVRAQLALADGDGEAAERWARSAVDYASLTDQLRDQANTKLDLARLLTALERPEAATAEARAALELFLTKGDRPGAQHTRALLDQLRTDQ